jgi:hypothetical protein
MAENKMIFYRADNVELSIIQAVMNRWGMTMNGALAYMVRDFNIKNNLIPEPNPSYLREEEKVEEGA